MAKDVVCLAAPHWQSGPWSIFASVLFSSLFIILFIYLVYYQFCIRSIPVVEIVTTTAENLRSSEKSK